MHGEGEALRNGVGPRTSIVTRLLLVRHGRSELNAQGRPQGWLDSPLDEVGRRQARAAARRLQQEGPEILYTSTLRRASETAEIMAQVLGVPLVADERLKERNLGAIAGLTNKEIEERFPEWVRRWREAPGRVPPPGAEGLELLWRRVEDVFEEIRSRHPTGTVGVVSHGGVLGVYLTHVAGAERGSPSSFSLGNGSLSVVEFDGLRLRIRLANDQSHLEDEKRR
jgi:probable phosphoglycerate mutase